VSAPRVEQFIHYLGLEKKVKIKYEECYAWLSCRDTKLMCDAIDKTLDVPGTTPVELWQLDFWAEHLKLRWILMAHWDEYMTKKMAECPYTYRGAQPNICVSTYRKRYVYQACADYKLIFS